MAKTTCHLAKLQMNIAVSPILIHSGCAVISGHICNIFRFTFSRFFVRREEGCKKCTICAHLIPFRIYLLLLMFLVRHLAWFSNMLVVISCNSHTGNSSLHLCAWERERKSASSQYVFMHTSPITAKSYRTISIAIVDNSEYSHYALFHFSLSKIPSACVDLSAHPVV